MTWWHVTGNSPLSGKRAFFKRIVIIFVNYWNYFENLRKICKYRNQDGNQDENQERNQDGNEERNGTGTRTGTGTGTRTGTSTRTETRNTIGTRTRTMTGTETGVSNWTGISTGICICCACLSMLYIKAFYSFNLLNSIHLKC